MLENVKSSYIFDYVEEKKVLELLKCSKAFQNRINMNLEDYKIYSGKYIIYEKVGKGKIYNVYNDKKLFEGEFLNGKKWNRKRI